MADTTAAPNPDVTGADTPPTVEKPCDNDLTPTKEVAGDGLPQTLEDKAKAILLGSVDANKKEEQLKHPKGEDPLVLQAQAILLAALEAKKQEREEVDLTMLEAQDATPEEMDGQGTDEQDEFVAKLPPSHRQLLRQCYQDYTTGEWQSYFVGTLKSFSSQKGYGFLSSSRSEKYWGVDVFVHKSQVPVPWNLGAPVEFAVVINQRGQPQATDCSWLPKLPTHQHQRNPMQNRPMSIAGNGTPQPGLLGQRQGGYQSAPNGAAIGGPMSAGIWSTNGPSEQDTTRPPSNAAKQDANDRPRDSADGPFYLGTLKSFSSAQGYGFLQSDEVSKMDQRDIYLDKSQLPCPPAVYTLGQTVVFSVNRNARGQPQARNLSWDIPVLPAEPEQQPQSAGADKLSERSLGKLCTILGLLNKHDASTAVVTAIDAHGAEKTLSELSGIDVDYISFVLDRIGAESEAAKKLKDFVKMLLLLMLAKTLKQAYKEEGVQRSTRWLVLLASSIDPSADKQVEDNFAGVVEQIEIGLRGALSENPNLREVSHTIEDVIQKLNSKGR